MTTVTLARMRELGTIDAALEQFLTAAVRARKSIVVSGAQGSGKTTGSRTRTTACRPGSSSVTSEPQDVVTTKALRDTFALRFGTKDNLSVRFGQPGTLRNAIRQTRTVDDVTRKDAEVALLRTILGAIAIQERGGQRGARTMLCRL